MVKNQSRLYLMHVFVLLICSFLLSYNGTEGSMKLSRKEELEIENELKLLNKPANKSIKTQYGDIYDCVDFYKQPAFDHPLLKNHNFHPKMRPSYARKGQKKQHTSSRYKMMRLPGGGCPVGTVPIRRITKEDLIRERHASRSRSLAVDDNSPLTHYAVVRTKASNARYGGAGGILSVHNPEVESNSYSAARFKISSGPDAIQYGWRVDPILYGDNLTRLFIYTDAGQSHCFNTRCPGFIVDNTDYPLDAVLEPVSKPGGPSYEEKLFIVHDPPNGNWWLDLGFDSETIGWWPKKIFTGLADVAPNVEWGGETYGPEGGKNPEMGSGEDPYSGLDGDTRYVAYFSSIEVINEQSQTVDANNLELYADANYFYNVKDEGYVGGDFRHLIIYGGDGCIEEKNGNPPICHS